MKRPVNNKLTNSNNKSNQKSNNKNIQNEPKIIIKHDLTKEQKQDIKEAFDSIDTDGSGYLDVEELITAMKALGLDNGKDDVNRILEDMDKNKDGKISYEEFLKLLTIEITDKDHAEQIKKLHFIMADEDSLKINFNSLRKMCDELGEHVTDDEIKEMIEEADTDNDAEVDENDFYNLMKKINVLEETY